MPSLVSTAEGTPFFILRRLTSLGRDSENDIKVDSPTVAPTHAHIKIDDGRFQLVPLSRKHPVLVNGRKVRKHTLEHGDTLQFGEIELKFNLWDEPGTMELARPESPANEAATYRRLAEFCSRLAIQEDIQTLLDALMDEVVGLVGADKGFMLFAEEEGFTVRSARNLNRETIDEGLEKVSDSIVAQVIEQRKSVIVSDALNDTIFSASHSVIQLKLCSVMCVPLLFGGRLLGVIYVGNDNVVNLFESTHLEILNIFASQAALLLANAIQRDDLRQDNAALRAQLDIQRFGEIIGACDAMNAVYARVDKVAKTDINVLILGETGTGKELIAREIHRRSPRVDGPFVAINCGAVPENLMESVLFGHRKGAFTGAHEDKKGSFAAAHGGTLFLDEIGEMPARLQVKLLRAIQERTVTRVGDSRPTRVDIRLLTATHVDLDKAITDGRFREDLFYRINVVSIGLPPLRDRDDDVVMIGQYLIDRFSTEYSKPVRGFSRDAILALKKHSWPGNIRELENRLKKAIVLSEGELISGDDLDLDEAFLRDRVLPLTEARDAFQRRYIDKVLALNCGNRTKTARDLGVDPRTIFRHLEKLRDEDGEP